MTDEAASKRQPDWMTLTEAAEHLRVSRKTISRHISAGRLRAYATSGKTKRVRRQDLDALQMSAPAAASDQPKNLAVLAAQMRARHAR